MVDSLRAFVILATYGDLVAIASQRSCSCQSTNASSDDDDFQRSVFKWFINLRCAVSVQLATVIIDMICSRHAVSIFQLVILFDLTLQMTQVIDMVMKRLFDNVMSSTSQRFVVKHGVSHH